MTGGSPQTKEEITAVFAPDPEEEMQPEKTAAPASPSGTQRQQEPARTATKELLAGLPSGGAAKRRRSGKQSYVQQHFTLSLRIDTRLEKPVRDFFERGADHRGNQTVFASALMLQLLIDAGYPLDPHLLENNP